MPPKSAHELLEDPEFQKLARQKNTITLILTIVELVLYFGFIALIAYNKAFLGHEDQRPDPPSPSASPSPSG